MAQREKEVAEETASSLRKKMHQEEQNRVELNKMISDFEQRLRRSQLAEQVCFYPPSRRAVDDVCMPPIRVPTHAHTPSFLHALARPCSPVRTIP